jgi:LPS export ABC transporter protein LptC
MNDCSGFMEKSVKRIIIIISLFIVLGCLACTFKYGEEEEESGRADITMRNVNYVRVREGKVDAVVDAKEVEIWEKKHEAVFKNIKFKYYGRNDEEEANVNGEGRKVYIWTERNDVIFDEWVYITIESEEMTVSAKYLEWDNEKRELSAKEGEAVKINKFDGSEMTGYGFKAYGADRTWEMEEGASGVIIGKKDEEEELSDKKNKKEKGNIEWEYSEEESEGVIIEWDESRFGPWGEDYDERERYRKKE